MYFFFLQLWTVRSNSVSYIFHDFCCKYSIFTNILYIRHKLWLGNAGPKQDENNWWDTVESKSLRPVPNESESGLRLLDPTVNVSETFKTNFVLLLCFLVSKWSRVTAISCNHLRQSLITPLPATLGFPIAALHFLFTPTKRRLIPVCSLGWVETYFSLPPWC